MPRDKGHEQATELVNIPFSCVDFCALSINPLSIEGYLILKLSSHSLSTGPLASKVELSISYLPRALVQGMFAKYSLIRRAYPACYIMPRMVPTDFITEYSSHWAAAVLTKYTGFILKWKSQI
jgi:hypothetical protein